MQQNIHVIHFVLVSSVTDGFFECIGDYFDQSKPSLRISVVFGVLSFPNPSLWYAFRILIFWYSDTSRVRCFRVAGCGLRDNLFGNVAVEQALNRHFGKHSAASNHNMTKSYTHPARKCEAPKSRDCLMFPTDDSATPSQTESVSGVYRRVALVPWGS